MDIEFKQIYPPVTRLRKSPDRAEDTSGRDRTAANYRSAWNKFVAYKGRKVRELTIADLTAGLVQEFVMWLLQDKKSRNDEI